MRSEMITAVTALVVALTAVLTQVRTLIELFRNTRITTQTAYQVSGLHMKIDDLSTTENKNVQSE